jgi:CRP-like cAMP-binding protein
MFETIFWSAFITGIISACSMPLGSITSFFWQPKNRALAFLMAFGGGALLAALVIDLVGSTKEKGHLLELIVGSIIGSLFFTLVDKIVNKSGGFLRKPSTLLTYLTQQESYRFEQRITQLKRLSFFGSLPQHWRKKITQFFRVANYSKGVTLYRQGDLSESLYIIDTGKIDLLDPQAGLTPYKHLKPNDIFGMLAFLTGCPHQTVAVVVEDCQLAVLTRTDFEELLEISPYFVHATLRYIQSEEVANYLQTRQGLNLSEVQEWVSLATNYIQRERKILPAVSLEQKETEFLHYARQIRRFDIFNYLPQQDLEEFAARLIYRNYPSGTVFFQPNELSDNLFFLHQGQVEIFYPIHLNKPSAILVAGDTFGELAFITKASHTVTAIAKSEVGLWILRQQDFGELLYQSKSLVEAVKSYLDNPSLQDYLQKRQNFDSSKSSQWVKQALENMNAGRLIPSVKMMEDGIEKHKNAPMSIWLGLLMDAIPEALTIGAHMASHPISATLIAGVFIANYPEALSSSKGMKEQGFSIPRILIMWTSIMVLTGILSALGSVIFADAPDSVISFLESMAAGAMLTVIAQTMLPEAYAKGESIVGLSTLLGFLAIIVIKSFE